MLEPSRTLEPLLTVREISKSFGALRAVDRVSLDLEPGEILGLIGPNGAGKSTFVKLLAGEETPDHGQIHYAGTAITKTGPAWRAQQGLARSFQISSIFPAFTVLDNIAMAVQGQKRRSHVFWRRAGGDPDLEAPAMAALRRVGLGDLAMTIAGDLAHGQKRQLELAMVIASEPKVLLLDEPMAGLGPDERRVMTALLAGIKQDHAMLLVEHDMDVVFALADRLAVLVQGALLVTGRPDEVRGDPKVQRAYLNESIDIEEEDPDERMDGREDRPGA